MKTLLTIIISVSAICTSHCQPTTSLFPSDSDLSELGREKIKSWPRGEQTLGLTAYIDAISPRRSMGKSQAEKLQLLRELNKNLPYHRSALLALLEKPKLSNVEDGYVILAKVKEFPHPDTPARFLGIAERHKELQLVALVGIDVQANWISWRKFSANQLSRIRKFQRSADARVSKRASEIVATLKFQKEKESLG